MTKQIDAFRNFSNAPKKALLSIARRLILFDGRMVVYPDNRTEFVNMFYGKTRRVLVVKLGPFQAPESLHCDVLIGGLLIFS